MSRFLETLLRNHVLANLSFVLVLVIGLLSYQSLPRQQDPTINFNWLVVTTVLPGASALDVEKKVTDPIEDAARQVQNIKFISSNSRQSVSSILIRFQDIDARTFDKRVNDLRREIQNVDDELPEAARDPVILEITSANAFPSATVAVVGENLDENLRVQARNVERDLERLVGVDRVDSIGLPDPELHVVFDPPALEALGVGPTRVADTVTAFFQDVAAGDVGLEGQSWLVRLVGSDADPGELAARTLVNTTAEVPLSRVARVFRTHEQPAQLTSIDGRPAVLFAVMKQADANTLDLLARIRAFRDTRNVFSERTGVRLVLVDDQTVMTTNAIDLMQNNALIGLFLVLLVAWVFLGTRIALLTAIGIPFVLAGTFWVLSGVGETLNVMVLLGVVIVLGMLVDDAVVVVEGIYYRIRHGMDALQASLDALREVAAPVTAAVLTTVAAFGSLILLPGILGDFMRVVPLVVVTALLISLVEAFWMLPAHVIAAKVSFERPSRIQAWRVRVTHWIQIRYVRLLIGFLRHRWLTLCGALVLFVAAIATIAGGLVKTDFFAADTIRLFYVNVEMPPETPLRTTLAKVEEIERKVRSAVREGEARAIVSYAGNMFTETAPRLGDHLGQVMVGLNPAGEGLRSVDEMIADMRATVMHTAGPRQVSFLVLRGGPPAGRAIDVKVRGYRYDDIRAAADHIKAILADIPGVTDIDDDASAGRPELVLRQDEQAISRGGLNPLEVTRTIQLLVDGLVVTDMRQDGEKVEVRVKGPETRLADIEDILSTRIPLPDGAMVALSELVSVQRQPGLGNIRHHDFRRTITVQADIIEQRATDSFENCRWPALQGEPLDWTLCTIDSRSAVDLMLANWETVRADYPGIDLAIEGELDDIQESLDSLAILLVAGLGVMYAVLGTQFRSYWQPVMILSPVLMAFTGVAFGLLATQNPLSLYTLYGVVALAGIAVNAAIVLISAGNARLAAGMSVLHATVYAARRRVIPILITSLTTIAGLFSLATGLGGESLIWGPVATAIVWGLAFSTLLTLIVVPLLYRIFMTRSHLASKAN